MQRKFDALPLSAWAFWQDHCDVNPDGEKVQSLSLLGEGATFKDLFVLCNRHTAAAVPKGCSLHIFRKNTRPEWEDKNNVDGGHFRVFPAASTDPTESSKRLVCLWFDTVRSVVGEHFSNADKVVGVSFTNKPYRQILSVWLSETADTVVAQTKNDIQKLAHSALFAFKFMRHRDLPRNDFSAQERNLHRRVKTAPAPALTIDDDLDDDPRPQQSRAESDAPNPAASESPIQLVPCKSDLPLALRRGLTMHARSYSDSNPVDAFPMQPIVAPRPETTLRRATAFEPPTPDGPLKPFFTPTPLKTDSWADAWSPSMLQLPEQRAKLDPFKPGIKVPERKEAPDDEKRTLPPVPAAPPKSAGKTVTGPPQSDRKPFVCRGMVYPAGLNRKEYRAVLFCHEDAPINIPGSFPLQAKEIPDGDMDIGTYEKLKRAFGGGIGS